MTKNERHPYVDHVRDDLHRYVQLLLEDNERLQRLVAALESAQRSAQQQAERLQYSLRELDGMKTTIAILERDNARLLAQLGRQEQEADDRAREQARLIGDLTRVQSRSREAAERFDDLEQRNANLASLYLASYRLHGTVDRREVLDAIQEILSNLVGTEEAAVFELPAGSDELLLISSVGIDPGRYRGLRVGQGRIGAVAATGEAFMAGPGGTCGRSLGDPELTACIPLKVAGRVIGVVALFRLLPQKQGIEDLDRELFELLGTHAATALYCTSLEGHAAP